MRQIRTRRIPLSILISIVSITMLFSCGSDEGDTIFLGVPSNIQTVPGDGEVTIQWSPAVGATSYNIYWNTTGNVTVSDTVINSVSSPYVHTGLTNGTTYYYAVTAVNANGESRLSTEESAVPAVFSQKLHAPDAQSFDKFGNSVAISGDYAIVGAMNEFGGDGDPLPYSGTAYIFHRTSPNTWDEGTKIVAPDAQVYDYFGVSVSISGDYAIVGGNRDPLGAAYIFHRTGPNTWDVGTKIVAPDADRLGSSVSISGDCAIVNSNNKVFVFQRTGLNTWDAGTEIVAPDAQPFSSFGRSVSISGDYAIVGAMDANNNGDTHYYYTGAAYVFHRTVANTWDAGTKIVTPAAEIDSSFGWKVSISGDYAIVGAYQAGGVYLDPVTAPGAAYIFHRTGVNSWDTGTKLVAPDAQPGDYFGYSVSINGDYAIVGAMCEDGGDGDPLFCAGAAYIFQRTGLNVWDEGTKIGAPDAEVSDGFGNSVSISGDNAIVGASDEDGGSLDPYPDAGAAYIY